MPSRAGSDSEGPVAVLRVGERPFPALDAVSLAFASIFLRGGAGSAARALRPSDFRGRRRSVSMPKQNSPLFGDEPDSVVGSGLLFAPPPSFGGVTGALAWTCSGMSSVCPRSR